MTVELKKRDYKSFGPVAKVRFRPMCRSLGFEQVKSTKYLRVRNGWVDVFGLKTPLWGGNGFEIYWGIQINKDDNGIDPSLYYFLRRKKGKPASWDRYTKQDIQNSAHEAHEQFLWQAEPFLQRLKTREDVGWYYWDCNEKTLRELLKNNPNEHSVYETNQINRAREMFKWAKIKKLEAIFVNNKIPMNINLRSSRIANMRFIKYRRTYT